ncbi:DUF6990 domain-containing protein [Cochlodiniinecator piscidefendens]
MGSNSFETGNRLGCVSYLTKDYIDRALILAQRLSSDPLLHRRGLFAV